MINVWRLNTVEVACLMLTLGASCSTSMRVFKEMVIHSEILSWLNEVILVLFKDEHANGIFMSLVPVGLCNQYDSANTNRLCN